MGAGGNPNQEDRLGLVEKATFKTRFLKLGKERHEDMVWE